MRVILEPADSAGQRMIADGMKKCNLATVENVEKQVTVPPAQAALKFDSGYGKKHDVMMLFVEMMSKGLILETEKRLFELLASQTNLGQMSAIKALYYRCQREYVGK